MSYTSVVTEAWKLLKDGKKYILYYFGSIIGLTIFVSIGMVILFMVGGAGVLLSSSSTSASQNPSALLGSVGIFSLILGCVLYFVFILLIGAIDSGVYKGFAVKYKTDKMISFSEIVKKGLRYFIKYLLASLIVAIPMLIVVFVISFLGGLLLGTINNTDTAMIVSFIVGCLAILLYIPFYLLLGSYFITLKNAIIVEDKGITEAISYSFSFVKRHLGKLIGVILVFLLLSCLILLPYICLYFGASMLQVGGSIPSYSSYSGAEYSSSATGASLMMVLVAYCLQIIGSIYLVFYAMYANAYMIVSFVKIAGLDKKEDVKISEPVMANA